MVLTFKDLENFITVAKSRTLSEASEKLEMAQPSLSLGIKKLETELAMTLFIRSRDGIKLTPMGKSLLPLAENALSTLSKIKGAPGHLKYKIGCHPSVGMYILGDFLKRMHKEHSEVTLEIVNASSHEVNKMVASGDLDFGLVMNPMAIQGLITRYIGEDEVHVWEGKGRYQEKLIYNPQMIQSNSILSRWKNSPHERIEVQNLELITSLVNSGAGYGIIPAQVVKAQRFPLKIVEGTPSFKDKLAVVCYPEMLKSQVGKTIFEALKVAFNS